MKKILMLLSLVCIGCSTVSISEYVPDDHPYQRKYYAMYDKTLAATRQALTMSGWKIAKEVDPSVYERVDEDVKDRLLIITAPRAVHYGMGSHQKRLNVLVMAGKGNTTDVEVRYRSQNKVTFKQLDGYKEDGTVDPILKRIEEILK